MSPYLCKQINRGTEEKEGLLLPVECQGPPGKHGWGVGVEKSFGNHHSKDQLRQKSSVNATKWKF